MTITPIISITATSTGPLNGAHPAERQAARIVRDDGGGEPEIANDEPAQSDPRHDDALGLLMLYHRTAEGVNGVLMLGTVNPVEEKPEKKAPYRTQRFKIGDADGMAKEAVGRAGSANVYFAPAVIKPDLKKGARGKKKDIVAVLGFAADDDRDNDKPAVMPPIAPSAIVQTCEKPTVNRHPHWVLSRPLTLEEAEPIADLMKCKVGGDSGTGDLAHVWRVPDTRNHPNKTKLDRGRPEEPQPVKLVGGTMRPVDPDDLRRALESMPDLAPAKAKAKAKASSTNGHAAEENTPTGDAAELIKKLKPKLKSAIATEGTGDRSKHCFSVMCQLFDQGLSDAEVLTIAYGAPFARKYSDRGDLEAEISRVRVVWAAKKQAASTESGNVLDRMNNEFAVVKVGSKVRVMTLEERRGALIPNYMTLPDFKAFEDKYRIDAVNEETGDLKKIGRGTWWLKHHARRQHEAVVFEPGASEEETRGKFNLWRGFAVKPVEGDCSHYLSHVTDIICSGNDEHATFMLDLMALCVQRPGLRPEVAPVLKGLEGTGKGTMAHPYGRLFGPHYLQVSQPGHVVGHFNAHLQQTRVLFADEALFAGDPKIVGTFKALITEPENLIEPKGVDPYPAPNRLFIIMASNNDWVIPAGPDARRFFVLNVSDARKQDFAYFEKINKQMESGGMEALLYFLQNRDLTNFNVRNVPKTAALADQKARSRRGVDALVEHLCDEGRLPCAHSTHVNVAITSGEEKGDGFWPAARKLVPSLKHDSSRVIGKTLKDIWGCSFYEANGVRGLRFPTLADLRAKFDARHGKQEWGPIGTWGARLADGGENAGD